MLVWLLNHHLLYFPTCDHHITLVIKIESKQETVLLPLYILFSLISAVPVFAANGIPKAERECADHLHLAQLLSDLARSFVLLFR